MGILTTEIQKLKRDMQASHRSEVTAQQIQIPSSGEQVINIDDEPKQAAPVQNKVQSGADEYSKDHPKQGNFTSADVSITKVFDYSNK